MFGAIIGDICGSMYEFDNCKDVSQIELFKEGSYPTDDSVMSVAVAKALMDSKGMDDDLVKEHLINAMHYYGHLFPSAGYGGTFAGWLEFYDTEPYNSWGNGAGMRVSSVGWLFDNLNDVLHYAKLTAEVTHNHPEGIKGAQAIATCIFLARTGHSKKEIKEYIEQNFYKLDFTLDEIRPEYYFDVSCQGSCPQAIEAFLEGDGYVDTILKAISIGGDSDTIACMAGGIAEAYYGGVPKKIEDRAIKLLIDKEGQYERYNDSVLLREIKTFRKYM